MFPVRIPPLRERQEDIPLLVRHFTQQLSRRNNRAIDTIPSDTMEALVRYDWPGNIRELQNVIERAVIISKGNALRVPVAELRTELGVLRRLLWLPPERRFGNRSIRPSAGKSCRHWIKQTGSSADRKERRPFRDAKRSTLQFRMQKLGSPQSVSQISASVVPSRKPFREPVIGITTVASHRNRCREGYAPFWAAASDTHAGRTLTRSISVPFRSVWVGSVWWDVFSSRVTACGEFTCASPQA